MVRTDRELLPGRTQEISEAGMSAILPVQLTEGDKVELQIKLPSATASTRAIVRDRNVFRHGFEFVQPLHGIVGNQALTGDCQTCAGAGSILRALAGEEGVAFAQLKCPECGGTRLKQA
jgi:hypothetical protein